MVAGGPRYGQNCRPPFSDDPMNFIDQGLEVHDVLEYLGTDDCVKSLVQEWEVLSVEGHDLRRLTLEALGVEDVNTDVLGNSIVEEEPIGALAGPHVEHFAPESWQILSQVTKDGQDLQIQKHSAVKHDLAECRRWR